MPLGTLTIPRIDWKRLAHALECRITGQKSLLQEHDADLERLALKLVSNYDLSKSLEVLREVKLEEHEAYQKKPDRSQYVPIDLSSVWRGTARTILWLREVTVRANGTTAR